MKKSKEQKRQEAKERNLQNFPAKIQAFVDFMPGGSWFMKNIFWSDEVKVRLQRLQNAAKELEVNLSGESAYNTGIFWPTEKLMDWFAAHNNYADFLRSIPNVKVDYTKLEYDLGVYRRYMGRHVPSDSVNSYR